MKGQFQIRKIMWFAVAAGIFLLSFWLLGVLFSFGSVFIEAPETAFDNTFGLLVIAGILLFGAIFLVRIAIHTFRRSFEG